MSDRKILGDPLTGSLPTTHLIIPRPILGPTRPTRTEWPAVADPQAVTTSHLIPGHIATIRTRRGPRRLQIRVVARSHEPGKNRGRHYIVGMNRHGLCRSHWVDQIIRVEPVQLALPGGPAQPALGPATT